ncbi:MAG TPA: lipopolysaccharide biosynthesis protein [Ktedonobacteraceae bacterium]|nr:lipopolysaccharide biosynthesis protein [Ktedonobacteraceae bacterium]
MKWALSWLKTNSVMLINSGSLVGATFVNSVLGFLYWWVAARLYTPDVVGASSAAVSSMMLLGTFCMLGLGTLLITEIPRKPEQAVPLISISLLVVGVAGAAIGLLFAVIAPLLTSQFSYLNTTFTDPIAYAAGVSLTPIVLVLDQALMGLLRGMEQFYRNTIFAVVKLIALWLASLLFAHLTGMNVYTTWTLGNLFSLLVVVPALLKSKRPLREYFPQLKLLRRLGKDAVQHHLLNTMLQFTSFALPTIVTVMLSTRVNAIFYIAWMLVNFIYYITSALTIVLHAMNSAQHSTLGQKARMTIGISVVTSVVACLILQIGTTQILGVFGSIYVDGTWTLRVLLLAAFPLIIKNHYIAICRIQDRVKQAMWLIGPGCIVELVAAIGGAAKGGLLGLTIGWVAAVFLEAIFMLPAVARVVMVKKSAVAPQEDVFMDEAAEAIWLIETTRLPAIDTGRIPIVKPIHSSSSVSATPRPAWSASVADPAHRKTHHLKPLRLEHLTTAPEQDDSLADQNDLVPHHGDPLLIERRNTARPY